MQLESAQRGGAADPTSAIGPHAASTGDVDGAAAGPPSRGEVRLLGCIEVLRPDRVAGWVADRLRPEEPVRVACTVDGAVVASVAADRPRKDLAKAGIGTGRHGFELKLDPPLAVADLARCTIRASALDGSSAVLLPRRLEQLSGGAADLGALAAEIAALRHAVDTTTRGLAATLAEQTERIEAVEAVQARIEMAAGRLEALHERLLSGTGDGRGLRAMVALLAVIALAALGLGLDSIIRGG